MVIDNELERTLKKVVVAEFKVLIAEFAWRN
jgi:hypothetical protein